MLKELFGAVRGAASRPPSSDVLRLYQSQREATRRLMHEAMQLLMKSDFQKAAQALGMWRRGIIVFDNEDMSCVMMNYALLELRREGRTAVERFRADRSLYDADDSAVVDLLCNAQFRLLTFRRRAGDGCCEMIDRLTGNNGVLVDFGIAKSCPVGTSVATHVWKLGEGFWMSTGAGLPFSEAAEQLLSRRIRGICRCKLEDWPKLGVRQRTAVTALTIRCCLDSGGGDRMRYI
jgi:hypothetical protein